MIYSDDDQGGTCGDFTIGFQTCSDYNYTVNTEDDPYKYVWGPATTQMVLAYTTEQTLSLILEQ